MKEIKTKQTFINLQPAVISSAIVIILKAHIEKNDEGGDTPTNKDVLFGG